MTILCPPINPRCIFLSPCFFRYHKTFAQMHRYSNWNVFWDPLYYMIQFASIRWRMHHRWGISSALWRFSFKVYECGGVFGLLVNMPFLRLPPIKYIQYKVCSLRPFKFILILVTQPSETRLLQHHANFRHSRGSALCRRKCKKCSSHDSCWWWSLGV